MTTATPLAGSKVTMTMTLASLVTSSTLVAGRESTAVDQKDTDDAIDSLVGGTVTVGTTPTANTQIQVYLYGSYDDTNFSGSATGTDATLTPSAKELMKFLIAIPSVATTSNVAHKWGPFSVAQAFGGIIPVQWGCWITHNTGVNLNSTGSNHEVEYFPYKFESA